MTNNIFMKFLHSVQNILTYQPPSTAKSFVLKENEHDNPGLAEVSSRDVSDSLRQLDTLLRYARRLLAVMDKAYKTLQNNEPLVGDTLRTEIKSLQEQQAEVAPMPLAYNSSQPEPAKLTLSVSLAENQKIMSDLYQLPANKDIVIRQFTIPAAQPVKAMLVHMDGMVDKQLINMTILQPLMLLAGCKEELAVETLFKTVTELCLPSNQVHPVTEFSEVAKGVNSGDTALFIDGTAQALLIDSKGYEHRNVDRPQIEQSVRGAQVSFAETLRTNTGLIRFMLQSSDLITELIPVGKRVSVNCAMMYLKSLANPSLVDEVRRRIQNISSD